MTKKNTCPQCGLRYRAPETDRCHCAELGIDLARQDYLNGAYAARSLGDVAGALSASLCPATQKRALLLR